jgi:arginase
LPIVLGGDDSVVLATIAGVRRYFRDVSLIYVDRDAGLNEPATTPSGCVDGMVISHVLGRGAPELVRFWGEPPLVREPDVVLFGVERLDESERLFLSRSPLRRFMAGDISRMGAAIAAKQALDHAHGHRNEFVLHVDLDVISGDDFGATNLSAPGGLRLDEVREVLAFLVRQPRLAALSIGGYNPALDADGSAAKRLIELLVEVLKPRLEPSSSEEAPAPGPAAVEKVESAVSNVAAMPSVTAEPSIEGSSEPAVDVQSDQPTEPPNEPPTSSHPND